MEALYPGGKGGCPSCKHVTEVRMIFEASYTKNKFNASALV